MTETLSSRTASTTRVVNQAVPRRDSHEKLRGKTRYAGDLDIAGQLEGEHARFFLADPGSPTMVKDVGDETALYVLMPMRV